MRAHIFDKLSYWSLFAVIVLLPFFFLPFTNVPIETSKGLLVVIGLALSVIFWTLARFFDGKITLPKSNILLGGAGVILVLFLSSILSKYPQVSFFGAMFDPGSFYFILAGFVLMFCSSVVLKTMKQAKIILFGAVLSSVIVLIFQSLRLFVPGLLGWLLPHFQSGFLYNIVSLSFGLLTSKTDNLLGSWNSLGLFAGFSGLLSLLIIEFFSTNRLERWILGILTILSLAFVALVNFATVWVLLGISALVIFVYKVSVSLREDKGDDASKSTGRKVYFPAFSFIVIIISLFFFISGSFVGDILPSRLGIGNSEINPSFSSTMLVTKSVLKSNPIFGIGPNRFLEAWAKYKPAAVNTTVFGDSVFSYGSGLLPTIIATTGYLSILAWLVFFILLLIGGVKSVFSSVKNGVNWETMAFFVMSLYFFVAAFLYPAGSAIFFLAFAFAGVFIGLSASSEPNGEIVISFLSDHRKSFFSILTIIVLLIVSASVAFKYTERFVAVPYFMKSISTSDVSEAVSSISKALRLNANDSYLRAYSHIYLIKFSSLAGSGSAGSGDTDLQANLDQAVNGAQAAISYNPGNYLNQQALGAAYKVFGGFGVKDAFSKAADAYKQASLLNPLSPNLKLEVSNALLESGKTAEAKEYANAALNLKPNYINALLMLSQIAKRNGNNSEALSYARKALSLAPKNQELINYVNSLSSGGSNAASSDSTSDSNQ